MNEQDINNPSPVASLPFRKRLRWLKRYQTCAFDNFIPLPLAKVSALYDRQLGTTSITSIDVNDDQTPPQLLGTLYLLKDKEVNLATLPDPHYVAYIHEVTPTEYGQPYWYKKDYFVVDKARYKDYKANYMESAPIWGGFLHEKPTAIASFHNIPGSLSAFKVNLPSHYHVENGGKSVMQPFTFERYLKLYHILELQYDINIIDKIQSLPRNNLTQLGGYLAQYGKTEEHLRLLAVIKQDPRLNYDRIANLFNLLKTNPDYLARAKTIFFTFGKDNNPLAKWESQFDQVMADLNGFTQANCSRFGLATNRDAYNQLVAKIAGYWIYRVRCCIAHNKIGEYIATGADEEFVAMAIEPLLREVIYQAFQA